MSCAFGLPGLSPFWGFCARLRMVSGVHCPHVPRLNAPGQPHTTSRCSQNLQSRKPPIRRAAALHTGRTGQASPTSRLTVHPGRDQLEGIPSKAHVPNLAGTTSAQAPPKTTLAGTSSATSSKPMTDMCTQTAPRLHQLIGHGPLPTIFSSISDDVQLTSCHPSCTARHGRTPKQTPRPIL